MDRFYEHWTASNPFITSTKARVQQHESKSKVSKVGEVQSHVATMK